LRYAKVENYSDNTDFDSLKLVIETQDRTFQKGSVGYFTDGE